MLMLKIRKLEDCIWCGRWTVLGPNGFSGAFYKSCWDVGGGKMKNGSSLCWVLVEMSHLTRPKHIARVFFFFGFFFKVFILILDYRLCGALILNLVTHSYLIHFLIFDKEKKECRAIKSFLFGYSVGVEILIWQM